MDKPDPMAAIRQPDAQWITVEQMEKLCWECARRMKEKGITKINRKTLQEIKT